MKSKFLVLSFCLGGLIHHSFAKQVSPLPDRVPGQFLVQFESTMSLSKLALQSKLHSLGWQAVDRISEQRELYLVHTPEHWDSSRITESLKSLDLAPRFVEPNFIYRTQLSEQVPVIDPPNDPQWKKNWSLQNNGQADAKGSIGLIGADIGALEAWKTTRGSKEIIVAVIDTGIDLDHPDLKDNLWSKTLPSGKVVHGYDFVNRDDEPEDDNGHGTHVAGIIGAATNNQAGIAGINWEVQLMALKFLGGAGGGTADQAVQAIEYAVHNGARILNNSWGGSQNSQAIEEAIRWANDQGALFIAAAGNDRNSIDQRPTFPAANDSPNILAVAATTNQMALARYSNYGPKKVEIMAPGSNIFSTIIDGKYAAKSGTSMAAPHVSGVAALILSMDEGMPLTDLKSRLIRTGQPNLFYHEKIAGIAPVVHAARALANDRSKPCILPKNLEGWATPIPDFIESEHPYAPNTRKRFKIRQVGAKVIQLGFKRIGLEKDRDMIVIRDWDENVVAIYQESRARFWSVPIAGGGAIVELISNDKKQDYGFMIDRYRTHGPVKCLNQLASL